VEEFLTESFELRGVSDRLQCGLVFHVRNTELLATLDEYRRLKPLSSPLIDELFEGFQVWYFRKFVSWPIESGNDDNGVLLRDSAWSCVSWPSESGNDDNFNPLRFNAVARLRRAFSMHFSAS